MLHLFHSIFAVRIGANGTIEKLWAYRWCEQTLKMSNINQACQTTISTG